jgi:lipid II:glycine glycyltransferase (peptidoglycan interpeptide bridge formation enzyme)
MNFKADKNYSKTTELIKNTPFSDIFQDEKWLEVSAAKGWNEYLNFRLEDDDGNTVIAGNAYIMSAKYFGNYIYFQHGPLIHEDLLDDAEVRAQNWGEVNGEKARFVVEKFVGKIKEYAEEQNYFAVVMEPLAEMKSGYSQELIKNGFLPQPRGVLPKYPMFMDLTIDKEDLLASLDKNTRYNVRYAGRKGIKTEFSYPTKDNQQEVDKFFEIMDEVSDKKGYDIPNRKFFKTAWKNYMGTKKVAFGWAKFEDEIVSANFTQFYKDWAGSYYTANTLKYRKKRTSYKLKWDTIIEAKKNGMKVFDMWGWIPGLKKGHPEYGYGRFKRGFNPEMKEFAGRLILPISSAKYMIWKWLGEARYKAGEIF